MKVVLFLFATNKNLLTYLLLLIPLVSVVHPNLVRVYWPFDYFVRLAHKGLNNYEYIQRETSILCF